MVVQLWCVGTMPVLHTWLIKHLKNEKQMRIQNNIIKFHNYKHTNTHCAASAQQALGLSPQPDSLDVQSFS